MQRCAAGKSVSSGGRMRKRLSLRSQPPRNQMPSREEQKNQEQKKQQLGREAQSRRLLGPLAKRY